VHVRDAGVTRYRTPLAGEITLAYEAFAVVVSPGQTLYVFSAEPGNEDEHKLKLLNSLAP
jgi:transcription regulator MmyB-like protein